MAVRPPRRRALRAASPAGRVALPGSCGSSCSLRYSWLDDAVQGAGDPRESCAARRERSAEAGPVVGVGQLGVGERWCLGVASAHVLGEPFDPLGVLAFDAEVVAGDIPVGAVTGAGGLD